MTRLKYGFSILLLVAVIGFVFIKKQNSNASSEKSIIDVTTILNKAEQQFYLLKKHAKQENKIPRTLNANGVVHWTNTNFDWTEGFFPGSCWYLYEYSNKNEWKNAAEHFQSLFENHKYVTTNHDLGFIFNCSYGNGYRLTNNEAFKEVLITAADSLSTRYNTNVGCLKSWDVKGGWQSKRNWEFPVIIDNMMNLELLFKASEFTGKPAYKEIAISHANTTIKNHFRKDYSSYHVIDYNPETGEVRSKQTAQGFADESSWARGQAWGLYGYTVCYRYTKDKRYLQLAENIAKYILSNNSIPEDGVPYWDYDTDNIPNTPRDVSAATITLSALIELDSYTKQSYFNHINKLITTLSSSAYTAKIGENQNFVLKHSVGSIPHNNEIDVPLNYADYYYIEALLRYKKQYLNIND
ncbi:glycoside hydrolase family 88 protein [Aestuariibaculum sediminum]|uniref:Glycoside hydrolase family 88 protein n=1 Tax=Aestuariibaculum sediminum TaxID=2770637 RepID=A0A8J6Q2S3_9FLAO|nr:glycoside hydrolase family 88 protein [Aestuariibaculum sediminum]MBD0832586.1 glycoside hydrolase family 88 protein [Aestuariibaculum sediminum]